jgi:hypothetical protein
MKKILKWFGISILSIFILIFTLDFIFTDPIGDCASGGGCWDDIGKTCRKDEPNAQQLCDRNKPENRK